MSILFLVAATMHPAESLDQLAKADRARDLASLMISRLGGPRLWRSASMLCLTEAVPAARASSVVLHHFYRDLRRPRIRVDRPDGHMVLTSSGAWQSSPAGIDVFPADRRQRFVTSWPTNIYVLYRRIAWADPRLSFVRVGHREFDVHERGIRIASFKLDKAGAPIRWRRFGADTTTPTEEWIYGPVKSFGAVRFPSWGVRSDGTERFQYHKVRVISVSLSDDHFPPTPRGTRLAAPNC